jgi:hypothetical protein
LAQSCFRGGGAAKAHAVALRSIFEKRFGEATSISEAASKSVAASESPVEPESTTVETTTVESTAAETTSMEPSTAETTSMTSAAARECFVVRGHQSSDDKRGNERRRDFGSHNAFSVSLDGCGKNEELLPR